MRMKCRIFLCFFVTFIMLALSCRDDGRAGDSRPFTIVTSFYPVYVIAKNVADGIDGVRVINMTPPVTGCLHDYSITAADMKNLEGAGILLLNGAGMESFLGDVHSRFPGLKTAELSRGIVLIRGAGGNNPHVWTSVTNVMTMTRNCAESLAASDPDHAAQYRANAARYTARLASLKNEIDPAMKKFRGRRIITFHEAFPYFAAEYGLVIVAVIEREPGSEPSAKELAETIDMVKRSGIKVLFTEPQYPPASAEAVARETGAAIYVLDPAVTGDDSTDAYIDIMKKNLAVLEMAFK